VPDPGVLLYTPDVIGETVGNYRITDLLSKGGMGVVYTAEHVHIGRKAAVKVLLPSISGKPDVLPRFFAEARATAAIGHPGIVEIFDFGRLENGNAYLIMELLDGVPLARRLSMPMAADRALALMEHITSALAAAHAKGIVHRDLKPANIVLVPDPGVRFGERTKLLDFGIAKLADNELGKEYATRTGTIMGTPAYMAPEQCRGASDVDHRADLYALGCILFHMLCARPPFLGFGAGEIIGMQQFVPPPPPRSLNAEIPPEVEALVLRLLEKDPAARVQSTEELLVELSALTPREGHDTVGWSLRERQASSYGASSSRKARREPTGTPLPATPAWLSSPSSTDHSELSTRSAVELADGNAAKAAGASASSFDSIGPTEADTRGASGEQPTTFTSAVHSAEAGSSAGKPVASHAWRAYAAGFAILMGAGFGAWVVMSEREPPRQPTQALAEPVDATPQPRVAASQAAAAAVPGADATSAPVVSGGQAASAGMAAGAHTAQPAAAGEEILVTITSTPSAATVYLDDQKLGTTPLERHAMRPGQDRVVFTVKKSGYHDRTIALAPPEDDYHVKLDRRSPRTSAPAPGQDSESRSNREPQRPQRPVDPNSTINPFAQ
jgi:serine/threonine protein kinase